MGITNPLANPDDYLDIDCPCSQGAVQCPVAEAQRGELFQHRSVTTDTFFDLSAKDIHRWILRTDGDLREARYYPKSPILTRELTNMTDWPN